MKTFIVEVDLIGTCGDTLVYIVKEESAILAKKIVKDKVISIEEFTTKYLQDIYLENFIALRNEIIGEYKYLEKEASEEYIEDFLNEIGCQYSTNDKMYSFTRKDIIDNFDELKKVIIEVGKIHSYEYAVEFAKISEISEERGIHYSSSIYHGC